MASVLKQGTLTGGSCLRDKDAGVNINKLVSAASRIFSSVFSFFDEMVVQDDDVCGPLY